MAGQQHGLEHTAEVAEHVDASPEQVWAVLADGWLYPLWVVGAARIRGVDPTWPQEGSRIHHSFGLWPALIDDHTRVLEVVPGRRIVLKARGWPAGEAHVHVELEAEGSGTRVRLWEDAVAGPGMLVPKPLRQLALHPRNVESLRRLGLLAVGRTPTDVSP